MNQESYQTIEDYAKIHEIENIGRPKRRPYTGFSLLYYKTYWLPSLPSSLPSSSLSSLPSPSSPPSSPFSDGGSIPGGCGSSHSSGNGSMSHRPSITGSGHSAPGGTVLPSSQTIGSSHSGGGLQHCNQVVLARTQAEFPLSLQAIAWR
jgi:hypothetical protein